MNAIVYMSQSGFTREYAEMLGEKTGLPVLAFSEAKKNIKKGSEIIFLSWVMAGSVTGYKKAKKSYDIKALCAVGLDKTAVTAEAVKNNNKVPHTTEFFILQGGYAPDRLKGIYKKIMAMVVKMLIKNIETKETKTEADIEMLSVLKNGGSFVKEENINEILDWCKSAGVIK